MRIGFGYDSHRLIKGRKFILGGLEIPHEKGLHLHNLHDLMYDLVNVGKARIHNGVLFPLQPEARRPPTATGYRQDAYGTDRSDTG